MDASATVLLPAHVADDLAARFRAIVPLCDLTVVPFEADGTCHGDPSGASAIFRYFPNDRFSGKSFGNAELQHLMARAPHLRWVQTNASGVDSMLFPALVESDIILTSGASVNQGPVAESVLALMLAIAKRIPDHVRNQSRSEWQRYQKIELSGSTVAIIGYGHIGEQAGRLCDAFGMRVLAVRKRVDQGALHATAAFAPEQLADALGEADFVVLTAARLGGERALIGSDELVAMKRTAWLINVGRGSLVDEPALLAALTDRTIAGAALDVFEREPLPSSSPLWQLPNALLTPHNSASSPWQDERTLNLFAENFRRWAAGEPLLNVIDKRRGY